MDRYLHQNLSSCGQTAKFTMIPACKHAESLIPSPHVLCGVRTEEILPSKRFKLSSSSSSWSYFQVFGHVHGCMNEFDSGTCQTGSEHTYQRAGPSRVLAAWEKIQSWCPAGYNSEANSRGESVSTESPLALEDQVSRQRDVARQFEAKAGAGNPRNPHISRVNSIPSRVKIKTRRHLAEAAITQALSPSLRSWRHGEGELGLRMANFLSTFVSSARTNEAWFCEKRVQKSIQSLRTRTDAAESEVKAIQSWIDDAEDQLLAMPSERDIEWFEALLEDCVRPPQVDYSSSPLRVLKDDCLKDQLKQFLQTTADMKLSLANLPTLAEIQKLHQEFELIDRSLWQCSDTAKEAVSLLRSAITKGEVAWLRNLELDAACLDALARTVIPLEELFSTNSYEVGCHLDDAVQQDS